MSNHLSKDVEDFKNSFRFDYEIDFAYYNGATCEIVDLANGDWLESSKKIKSALAVIKDHFLVNKPIDFFNPIQVRDYISYLNKYIRIIENGTTKTQEEYLEIWRNEEYKKISKTGLDGFLSGTHRFWDVFLMIIAILTLGFLFYHAPDMKNFAINEWDLKFTVFGINILAELYAVANTLFILVILGIATCAIFWVLDQLIGLKFEKKIRNKLKNTRPEKYPNEIINIQDELFDFKENISFSEREWIKLAERNQEFYNKLKEKLMNSSFDWNERKKMMFERLELMQAELEHAKRLSENLTEQHEKTEAIRAKYAIEMMDAQVMLAEKSDQALKEKLAMVNAMMGV